MAASEPSFYCTRTFNHVQTREAVTDRNRTQFCAQPHKLSPGPGAEPRNSPFSMHEQNAVLLIHSRIVVENFTYYIILDIDHKNYCRNRE